VVFVNFVVQESVPILVEALPRWVFVVNPSFHLVAALPRWAFVVNEIGR
jgi:hypothetical protein